MRINLNWNPSGAEPERKRWFKSGPTSIDLDLGCLFELSNGDLGVVQALGNCFGDFDSAPYIYLDGDDRSGDSSDGENIFVNLAHVNDIKRLLVFAFIYEGAPSWDKAQGVLTLCPESGSPITVDLDHSGGGLAMCAVARVENEGGHLNVTREIKYFRSHSEMDRHFDWGLQWVAGRK